MICVLTNGNVPHCFTIMYFRLNTVKSPNEFQFDYEALNNLTHTLHV